MLQEVMIFENEADVIEEARHILEAYMEMEYVDKLLFFLQPW